jgi:archaemetzincin
MMFARTVLPVVAFLISIKGVGDADFAWAAEEQILAGDKVITTAKNAAIRAGTETLLTVDEGTRLVARAVEGKWIRVDAKRDGKTVDGWIENKYLDLDEPTLPANLWRLVAIHERFGPPEPRDWVVEQRELGQTYLQYVHSQPVRPDEKRRVICVQPVGEFNERQRRIINLTAEFLGIYFDLPVKVEKDLVLTFESIPSEARRTHPTWGQKQVLSTYVLYDVLKPRLKELPEGHVAYIAFTNLDLWPGRGWNFVFGQASLRDRVGVWSMYRFGDPTESDEAFRLCLRRTIRIGSHEMGHMFSMKHCILFQCNMCGSNHLGESDRHPLALCPHCLAKLCWATKADPEQRFAKLASFCEANGLEPEQEFYEKSLAVLRGE